MEGVRVYMLVYIIVQIYVILDSPFCARFDKVNVCRCTPVIQAFLAFRMQREIYTTVIYPHVGCAVARSFALVDDEKVPMARQVVITSPTVGVESVKYGVFVLAQVFDPANFVSFDNFKETVLMA